jgi:hypothetical protein
MGISLGQPLQPDHPVISGAVFQVVNLWSQIDMNLAYMLCHMTQHEPETDIEIYLAIKSLSKRHEKLIAIAERLLTKSDHCLINATIAEFGPSQRVRNSFCHGVWGLLRDQPDRWLLMTVEDAARYYSAIMQTAAAGGVPDTTLDQLNIYAWKERDFVEAVEEAKLAHNRIGSLNWAVGPMQKDYLRDRILETGNVRTRYDRLMARV